MRDLTPLSDPDLAGEMRDLTPIADPKFIVDRQDPDRMDMFRLAG